MISRGFIQEEARPLFQYDVYHLRVALNTEFGIDALHITPDCTFANRQFVGDDSVDLFLKSFLKLRALINLSESLCDYLTLFVLLNIILM